MKHLPHLRQSSILILLITVSFSFFSCQKNTPVPGGSSTGSGGNGSGGSGSGGSGSGGGSSSSAVTVTFKNPAFTPLTVTLKEYGTETAAAGSSCSFTCPKNADLAFHAETMGMTSTGQVVGLKLVWDNTFNSGTNGYVWTMNVTSEYFYLNVINNNSSLNISKLYVNYGLSSQSIDNISIPNDGKLYSIGYYKAYSNSNVRAENGSNYWYWSSLPLSFTDNQSMTVTAN